MIKGFSHIGFDVEDLDRTIDFYETRLGFKRKFTMTYQRAYDILMNKTGGKLDERDREFADYLKAGQGNIWFVFMEIAPGQLVEFFPRDGQREKFPHDCYYTMTHFALETDDIQTFYQEVIAKGLVPDKPLTYSVDGTWQFWLHDPDGNRFEIYQYTEKSMQMLPAED